MFTSRTAWFFLTSAAVLIAQWELYRALEGRGFRPATGLGMAAGGILLGGAFQSGTPAMSFGLTMTVLAAFVWFLIEPRAELVAQRLGVTLLGVLYVPFLGAHVVLMRDLPGGPALTISFIGLTAFYDIAAFAAGSLFGKHTIAPRVSPKKTWEGAIGATLFVFVLALLAGPFIGPFTVASAAALAGVTAVVAPLGDLAESLLKRDLDVKDMGHLLPGHGGLLDRVDALLLVSPAAYWLARLMIA